MALQNGSFAAQGANSYDAAGWVATATTSSGEGAYDFATVAVPDTDQGTDTTERFDTGWADDFIEAFEGFFADLTYAFFDADAGSPKAFEDFEDLWGAGPATLVSRTTDPFEEASLFELAHGAILSVSVDSGLPQDIGFVTADFFDIAAARPEEVARVINAQAVGFSAQLYGASVRLRSAAAGPAHTLQVTGGDANDELAFSTDAAFGTPNGSPFIRALEFSYGAFSGEPFEAYEVGWGTPDLNADPGDVLTRYTTSTDSFEAWFTLDADPDADDALGRIVPTAGDGFFSGWDEMETI